MGVNVDSTALTVDSTDVTVDVSTGAKSIDDVLVEARFLLNDAGAAGMPTRFANADMIRHLNTALRELYTLRPDAYVGLLLTGGNTPGVLNNTIVPLYSTADLGQTPPTPFPVDDRLFFSAVVYYVVGRTELSDDEFTDDNRAMTMLQGFRTMLGGT